MKLEVGEVYLSASGEIVKIIYCDSACCYDIDEVEYFHDGKYLTKEHKKDLIAHIPKELHKMICELVNNYHSNNEAIKELEELENRSCINCNNFQIFNSKVARDSCSILNISDIGGCGDYFEPKKG